MVMSKNSSGERHGGVRRSLKTILGSVALVGELGFYPDPGCTNASPRSPSTGSRPASRAGEEPRPRPVQPRPIRAAPGSPPQGFGC